MYDLVDRAVAELDGVDRRMLEATRRWVHALTAGAAAHGGDFDEAMRALNRGSADVLPIERPCHARVGETEAVLLSLWRLVREGRDVAAQAAAAMIVDAASATAAVRAMGRVVRG